MTRFVVDAGAVLHLAGAKAEVPTAHKLLAPTLLRSQTLSALHEAVHRGEIPREVVREHLTHVGRIPIRLLGDAVLRRRAWDLGDQLGCPSYPSLFAAWLSTVATTAMPATCPDSTGYFSRWCDCGIGGRRLAKRKGHSFIHCHGTPCLLHGLKRIRAEYLSGLGQMSIVNSANEGQDRGAKCAVHSLSGSDEPCRSLRIPQSGSGERGEVEQGGHQPPIISSPHGAHYLVKERAGASVIPACQRDQSACRDDFAS